MVGSIGGYDRAGRRSRSSNRSVERWKTSVSRSPAATAGPQSGAPPLYESPKTAETLNFSPQAGRKFSWQTTMRSTVHVREKPGRRDYISGLPFQWAIMVSKPRFAINIHSATGDDATGDEGETE